MSKMLNGRTSEILIKKKKQLFLRIAMNSVTLGNGGNNINTKVLSNFALLIYSDI